MTRPPQCSVRNHAFFLDFDGTLVDFHESPARVRASEVLRSVIDTLHHLTGGATAVISGRSLSEIDRIFHAPPRLPSAGQHGMERRTASGRVHASDIEPARLDQVRRLLTAAVEKYPRLLLEDKAQSLALHYNRAPALADTARNLMASMRTIVGDPYVLLRGKNVVELKPGGRHKGDAILAFMAEDPFRGRIPVFAGDDVTDEDGFGVVEQLGGVSIKVGAGETAARYRLRDPASVIEWLLSQTADR